MKRRIVLAGGRGFLGHALAEHFGAQGCEVVVLTRHPVPSDLTGVESMKWNGKDGGAWESAVEGAHAVINLTGRSVNCRHHRENRREIIASRVDSVRAIGRAIRRAKQPPSVWIQTGSLAIYGDPGNRICDESAGAGEGFPVEVCRQWEEAFETEGDGSTRRVLFRIGFVLGPEGGALSTLERLTKCFLGGTVGHGRQWISWMHLVDFVRMVEWAVARTDISGVYNATGPNPVTNAEFMRQLRRALHRPWSPPAPAWAVRVGARAMGTESDLALSGRRCVPRRLAALGFWFAWPALGPALEEIYRPGKS